MKLAIAVLMIASMAGAQNLTVERVDPPKPKPLTCPKYQHEQYTPAHCANTCDPYGTACTAQCTYVAEKNVCVDDLHTVTEREWQEIVQRIKALEQRLGGKAK